MRRLTPQVGDIWLYDTSHIYSEKSVYRNYDHWLILKAGPANLIGDSDYDRYQNYYHSKDFAIYYLHLETGRYDVKIFYSKEFGEDFDLTGNPYYKKVA